MKATLISLTKQTLRDNYFEILVIDNGSTGDTPDVVSKFRPQFNYLAYFHENHPGLHAGRHRGLNESCGDILVFADDDIEAFPTRLEGIKESFEDSKIGLVGKKNIPNYESPPPDWIERLWETTERGRYITHFSLLDFGDKAEKVDAKFVFGCNFSIRKNLFLQGKGFHPDGMPQSLTKYRGDGGNLCSKCGKRIGLPNSLQSKSIGEALGTPIQNELGLYKKKSFFRGNYEILY